MNDSQLIEALGEVDTPTVCNALEIVMGGRTASGFTTRRVVPMDADSPPMVGYAVSAKLRASPSPAEQADGGVPLPPPSSPIGGVGDGRLQ